MDNKKILIIGCGAQAKYVIENASQNKTSVLGLVDAEGTENIGTQINGVEVICSLNDLETRFSPHDILLIIAYGSNRRKKEIASKYSGMGFQFATSISPYAHISNHVIIGEGSIINSGASILPNAELGKHTLVHSGCVIEHDCKVSNFVNLAPGVTMGGYVDVKEGAHIYTGAIIAPRITIGDFSIVGAGSVVLQNVQAGETVVGVPATPRKD